ncbi:hypothetical protein [Mycobacterium sherrisii]|uniref:hypothetical protein n=1 Tax=Mycobacterium sherrisii TaxID=243061 RepID=UPI000A150542|nr:hypothetical protein [Mycobacterium sherrisii]ORW77830.1 hypothetical protein AWC25_07525 [Mycobacterium sherrisii]
MIPGRTVKPIVRQRVYLGIGVAITLWAATVLWFAIAVVPLDVYWMSYYSASYAHGFVRRGLAGELVGMFPGHYFTVALGLRWVSTAVYLCGLAAVAAAVLVRRRRAERHLLVTMAIPLLPFGIPFAAYSARPDLFGGAALTLFATGLTFARSRATAIGLCLVYGIATAALTLVHEAIGLQFALGAVLAVVILGRVLSAGQGAGALLAVAPGALTAAAIAVFGRHDIAPQLCVSVPHRLLPNAFATITSPSTLVRYVIDGRPRQTDYHDWVCRNVLPSYDHDIAEALRSVGHVGIVGLTASFVFGAAGVAVTLWGLRELSGVPLRAFAETLRGRMSWASAGLILIVPVFLTGYDWTRWLTILAFDVGIVFILFAAGRPEIQQPPSPKTLQVFAFLVITLALIPIGAVPGFGGPLMA